MRSIPRLLGLLLLVSAALGLFVTLAGAQGVTTGAIAGLVTDTNGDPLPGAVITAVHEPTGTRYEAVTRADGRFDIREVRVGGPYSVTCEMTGFKTQEREDLFVKLGETLELTFELEIETIEE